MANQLELSQDEINLIQSKISSDGTVGQYSAAYQEIVQINAAHAQQGLPSLEHYDGKHRLLQHDRDQRGLHRRGQDTNLNVKSKFVPAKGEASAAPISASSASILNLAQSGRKPPKRSCMKVAPHRRPISIYPGPTSVA